MLKITTNTFIVVCFFYATYLPVIIYITHYSLVNVRGNYELQMAARAWIYSFGPVNCCFNPVFYVFRTKRFKQVCYRLWSGKINTSNEANIVCQGVWELLKTIILTYFEMLRMPTMAMIVRLVLNGDYFIVKPVLYMQHLIYQWTYPVIISCLYLTALYRLPSTWTITTWPPTRFCSADVFYFLWV